MRRQYGVEERSALSTEEGAESQIGCSDFRRMTLTKGGSFAIIRIRQFKTLRSAHRFGYRWNVGSSNGKSHDGAENAPFGRIFFRGSYRASYSLT